MRSARSLAPRLATGLAAAGVLAAPLAAAPLTAQAATCTAKPTVVATDIEGSKLVLGTGNTQKVDLFVLIDEKGCALSSVSFRLTSPDSYGNSDATKIGRGDKSGQSIWATEVTFNRSDVLNADAGSWHTTVTASNSAGSTVKAGPGFTVKRAAKLGTDASPEPVRKGRTITVKGTLQRADWPKKANVGYAGQKVTLQWKSSAKGSTYHTLKTVRTSAGGKLKTTVKAGKDGCFRYVYAGSSTTAAVTGGSDCVDVR